MPPAYKLKYFDVKGRAESIRYLFALAGVEYEDVRIKTGQEDWELPYGELPIIEFGGKQHQNHEIWRDLARKFGYYGSSNEDAVNIDVVFDLTDDLWPFCSKLKDAKEDEKPALRAEFEKGRADEVLGYLEKMLKKNNGGNGWFVGDKISLADVMVFNMIYDIIPWLLDIKEGEYDLKSKDALKAFMERFKSNQRIADWISRRGQSPK